MNTKLFFLKLSLIVFTIILNVVIFYYSPMTNVLSHLSYFMVFIVLVMIYGILRIRSLDKKDLFQLLEIYAAFVVFIIMNLIIFTDMGGWNLVILIPFMFIFGLFAVYYWFTVKNKNQDD